MSSSQEFRVHHGAPNHHFTDFDPRAEAVLIQANTLGRIVDDITTEQVDPNSWDQLITRLIERVLAS